MEKKEPKLLHGSLSLGLKGSKDVYDFVQFKTESVKERMCEEFLDNMFNDEPSMKKKYKKDPDIDDFMETYHTLTWVYKCAKTGNQLILSFHHYDNEDHEFEDKEPNVDVIINSIMPEPFKYMVDKLNENKNITVFVSRVPYTTTDFIIYYSEHYYEDPEPDHINWSCKYAEYINGEFKPIMI